MENYRSRIGYGPVPKPQDLVVKNIVDLTDETMTEHREKILNRMRQAGLDVLVIYADREHGTNFGYLTGYEPRFEESVLVLHANGESVLMLGNESLRMQQYSRIPAKAVHVPYFSLPDQPMGNTRNLVQLFEDSGISKDQFVGIVGWKMFTSELEDNSLLFDVPFFIVQSVQKAIGTGGRIVNAADLFIHPEYGARATVNANEIAHYEFGASLASSGMLRMINAIEPGKLETELAALMSDMGQQHNVQTICATGDRFTNAVVAPRMKAVSVGDKFSSTVGYRGGLSSRGAYIANGPEDLAPEVADYVEALAKPYYAAAVAWYENIGVGVVAGNMYKITETVLPPTEYGWHLNPGHLTAGEEWMSSPFFSGSEIVIKSGTLLQMDIIPGKAGYGGAGAEDGVAIADEALRAELQRDYPETWARFEARRRYMIDVLGIKLKDDVLPMSNIAGYMRPYLLNKESAFSAKANPQKESAV